jgi:hypothetical protein
MTDLQVLFPDVPKVHLHQSHVAAKAQGSIDVGEPVEEPAVEERGDPSNDWTVAEIKEWLDDHGINHSSTMRKGDLLGEALNYLSHQE